MSLVELARFFNDFEANLARTRLEAEGISAIVFDESTVYVGLATGVRLMVHQDDKPEAMRILSECNPDL